MISKFATVASSIYLIWLFICLCVSCHKYTKMTPFEQSIEDMRGHKSWVFPLALISLSWLITRIFL